MEKYLDFKEKIDIKKMEEVAHNLKNGNVAIFPTETVYGIGTNGLDEDAIKKIYKLKERPLSNPISLLVSSIDMALEVTQNVSEIEKKLMKYFFPGPFTIVLEKKECVPNILTAGGNTVGIRMPTGEIALKLIELAGVPLATSSANIAGKPSGTNYESIQKDLGEKVDYFIDNGESKLGVASTVVQVINGEVHILREGPITKEQINQVLNAE